MPKLNSGGARHWQIPSQYFSNQFNELLIIQFVSQQEVTICGVMVVAGGLLIISRCINNTNGERVLTRPGFVGVVCNLDCIISRLVGWPGIKRQ